MSEQHLNEVENMLFELRHAMIPQDMEITIAHGKKVDALEHVIKQTKQVDVLLRENESHFRNIKSMERRIKKLEKDSEKYRKMLEEVFKAGDLEDVWNAEDEYREMEESK